MTVFEEITTKAVQYLQQGWEPAQAWSKAADDVECAPSVRSKGCPRSAFVGLAQAGYIRGYQPQRVAASLSQNASYCVTGARILADKPALGNNRFQLWNAIREQEGVDRQSQNGVVDVLLALRRLDVYAPKL
ncbi:DUF6979 family protein [Deinococcus yavapaiensis]|uniref:Uncharacterized protein n=1 Tax=Deinococcus yavapaiensis KR-236 TaxID=694435 RepID=A0A318SQW9_9DEIO|nr:hypothetical protein [Deinococcus yavapaiensis]PYE55303.1 hypothetical protein DES52_103136 [Deinococcus yavapaiensis KR-236]